MRTVIVLALAVALAGCSGFHLSPAQRAALLRVYQIQQVQRAYQRPIQIQLYAPPAMVMPPYQRYAPPNVGAPIRCHPDLIGGQICR